MSSTLTFEPFDRKKKTLSDEIKFMLRNRYGEPIDAAIDVEEIPFLEGLIVAGVSEADKIINAIKKHGKIILKEEY